MAEVTLRGIHKTYPNGHQAISDLSLDIADGEFLVLVGPSGCGKSTALRMIAGLEEITGGELRIGDRVVNEVHPRARDIAMVFQNYALYPHMSVADNIGVALRLAKVPKAEIRTQVARVAELLDITALLDRKPALLSGGQRQRVAMGRAIVRQPKAFLMDEPLSNLDAKLRVQMRAEIARLQRDLKVTTIFVTHDQVEAMTMGDRVAVLDGGVLQQVDTPQHLYHHPDNLFVAGFIGSPSMNLMPATLLGNTTALRLRIGSQEIDVDPSVLARRPALADYVDRDLAFGIRPEDIHDTRDGSPSTGSDLSAEVTLVESLGPELLVHFELDAEPLMGAPVEDVGPDAPTVGVEPDSYTARIDSRIRPATRQRMALRLDTVQAHFFDLASGLAVRDLVESTAARTP